MDPEVYIGLGSNLGDRQALIEEALRRLGDREDIRITAVSPVYETQPVGVVNQPPFLNAAASLGTALSPLDLLNALLDVEASMGRVRERKWGPRTIDVDLLLYGQDIVRQEGLIVPHPLLQDRAFVLAPLCDLNPEFIHPVYGRALKVLRQALPSGVSLHPVGNLVWKRH